MNRRKSIRNILAGSAMILAGAPILMAACTKQTTDQGLQPGQSMDVDLNSPENAVLNNQGGYRIFQGILVANAGSYFFAVSSICTHQGCTVQFSLSQSRIICPCHGSEFSTNGSVLMGPAAVPLKDYQVTKTDNILKITL